VVCNSSLNPAKLKRHLETVHPTLKSKGVDYFKRKCNELKEKKTSFINFVRDDNKNALTASYLVSLQIAQQGEAFTIAEKLVKPCAKHLITCMLGKKYANKIDSVPLSDTTVSRRIPEMANYCEMELVKRLQTVKQGFTLQLDESTDVSGLAILLVFVRYIHEMNFSEDLLFCKALATNTAGEEIFNKLDEYFETHSIPWNSCHHICTDGAKAMLGSTKGVIARIKLRVPHLKNSHCCLHREALAVKRMPKELNEVLKEVIKLVNFIKARPLNSRIFTLLCEDMGSIHTKLLLHTEVRWLSRGKVLAKFCELQDEIRIFLSEHPNELADKLNDISWLQYLAYLADIFSYLNEVNLSLQGPNTTIFKVSQKIKSTNLKLNLWHECITNGNTECFAKLTDTLENKSVTLDQNVKKHILEHLSGLQKTFLEYFPPQTDNFSWVQNPFVESSDAKTLSLKEREQLIDISTDTTLETTYRQVEIVTFWVKLLNEYPEISERAVKVLMPFVTTYLCERSFSLYIATKTKYRNKLDAENVMRLRLTPISPNIVKLCGEKQAHPSH